MTNKVELRERAFLEGSALIQFLDDYGPTVIHSGRWFAEACDAVAPRPLVVRIEDAETAIEAARTQGAAEEREVIRARAISVVNSCLHGHSQAAEEFAYELAEPHRRKY